MVQLGICGMSLQLKGSLYKNYAHSQRHSLPRVRTHTEKQSSQKSE